MAKRPLPSPDLLRKLLRYEADTGDLYWRERPASMFRTAAEAALWNARYSGRRALSSIDRYGYRYGSVISVPCRAHRVIWAMHHGAWPEGQIDHINHMRADNRLSNLRAATQQGNGRNQKKPTTNTSGVVGVLWNKAAQKWIAQIKVDRRQKYLGIFEDFGKAVEARRNAERALGFHENHGN